MEQAKPGSLAQYWARVGGIAGILAVVAFITASVLGGVLEGPSAIVTLLGFAFGPLLCIAFLGLYHVIRSHRDSVALQVGTMFGVIAGAVVNTMIVVQQTLFRTVAVEARRSLGLSWAGLNAIQLGLDVSWDIFISLASISVGISMLSHPRFGRIFGAITSLIGVLLLVLNLVTFPTPPASAGLIDIGPVMGVWYLVISVQMLRSTGSAAGE
jgi:hypothetical protein